MDEASRRILEAFANGHGAARLHRQLQEAAALMEGSRAQIRQMDATLSAVVQPWLDQQRLAESVQALIVVPAVQKAALHQLTSMVRFSDVLRRQRQQLLSVFDAPDVQQILERFVERSALTATHDLIASADPDELDASLQDPDEAVAVPFTELHAIIAGVVEQAGAAVTDRNALVAVVYVIVFALCLQAILEASATMGLVTLVMGGSGHQVASKAARMAGSAFDRLQGVATPEPPADGARGS